MPYEPPSLPAAPGDGTIIPSDAAPLSPTPLTRTESLVSTTRKMRILLLSSDTGGGHRASAESLREALLSLYPDNLRIKIVDFWVDLAEGPFIRFPNQYAFLAKNPLLWKFTYEFTRFPPGRAVSECIFNCFGHRRIKSAFEALQPDLIISVHPLVNTLSMNVLSEMQRYTGIPRVPYITVVTDLGGAHPTWFHSDVDMTYIPSLGVRNIGLRVGLNHNKMRLLGLPVRKEFWEQDVEKDAVKSRLGLRVGVPTILAIGGGDGVGALRAVVETLVNVLTKRLDEIQIVVVCGKNERLKQSLSRKQWPCLVVTLGFVDNVSDWMTACDIICTKAGPGTIAESLIRGLPIIITSFLPGQEEANVNFVVENNVGAFAKTPKKIANIAANWLMNPELLEEKSRRCVAIARPHASLAIAEDVMTVALVKIKHNIEVMKKQRDERGRVTRNHLGRYIPNAAMIMSSSKESHLVFRLKFMLRVLLGGMLAHEALTRDADN